MEKNNNSIGISEEFKDYVYLMALENAVLFKGKANPKALIGKCIPKFAEMKSNMKEYMGVLNKIVDEVNSFDLDIQKEKILKINPNFFSEKKEKKVPKKTDGLPLLHNTENGVVVRFEPAPSGHLHLGHLFAIVANYALKEKFGGKFILRIADTNPDNIDLANYKKVIDDVNWMCDNNIDEIVYQSDRLEIYYKYLRQLVGMGVAYICKCEADVFKAYTDSKQACPCRLMSQDVQNRKLEKFMSGRYNPGEAVIRHKADLENKNPALRTFPLARINTNSHARVKDKYFVWPNMNLAVAVDDSLMNLTHVIRGKDHEIGMLRQEILHKNLGLKSPEYFHMGRMKFEDINLSKTDLTEKIANGDFSGWDDPRVPSILAYRKRGYKASAFRDFILSMGISKRDSRITSEEYHKGLDFYNKRILEKEANRAFFVVGNKKVIIKNLEEYKKSVCSGTDLSCDDVKSLKLNKHPEDKSRGYRIFDLNNEYFIDENDFNNLNKGDLFRLMHFGNFKVMLKTDETLEISFESKDYSKNLGLKRNIHFVPINNFEEVELVLPSNERVFGRVENLGNILNGTSFQFERFGFVRYDSKLENGKNLFYFTHK